MSDIFRQIQARDIEELFAVRLSVLENSISRAALAEMGITPEATIAALGDPLIGYLCERGGRIAGFAMGNLESGELSAIAVRPEYEGRGIGRELLSLVESRLWEAGHSEIWLWTGLDRRTRAVRLYLSAGWLETDVKDGRLYMKKTKSNTGRQIS